MSSRDCAPIHPIVLWAQREDKLFLTIEVWDVCEDTLTITPTSMSFFGRKGDTKQPYTLDLEFYSEIKTTPQSKSVSGRIVFLVIEKEEHSMWPRLCKSTAKLPFIKTDFDRWVDPEADDDEEMGMGGMGMPPGGFDFSKYSNFDNDAFAGMNGSEEFDSDNEDLIEEPLDEEIKKQLANEDDQELQTEDH